MQWMKEWYEKKELLERRCNIGKNLMKKVSKYKLKARIEEFRRRSGTAPYGP
jgi:hypothetical protein